jgi:hypothetical protein
MVEQSNCPRCGGELVAKGEACIESVYDYPRCEIPADMYECLNGHTVFVIDTVRLGKYEGVLDEHR